MIVERYAETEEKRKNEKSTGAVNVNANIDALNRKLQDRIKELELLVQVSYVLNNAYEWSEFVESVRHFFLAHFNIDGFALLLKTEAKNVFRILSSVGKDALREKTAPIDLNNVYIQKLILKKEIIYITGNEEKSNIPSVLNGQCSSILAIPAISRSSRILGVICLKRLEKQAFSSQEIETIRQIVTQIAVMLDKAIIYKKARELAFTDELTGIFNRRYFNQRYSRELGRAKRYKRTLSILMIDIDHFKRFNDTMGHLVGDDVLRKMARVFESNLRKADILCRYGGEEFVVILPEISLKQAIHVGEKLRKTTESSRFIGEKKVGKEITISVGVASYPENNSDLEEILSKADKALYEAKQKGRNRVVAGK
jgi:diguanylate cyclase (GGDEF)-like protein